MNRRYSLPALLISIVLIAIGCNSVKPYYSKRQTDWESKELSSTKLIHTIYLIGDAGEPEFETSDPVFDLLSSQLEGADSINNTVVFLGDNIYYNGMPAEDHPDRAQAETRLKAQLDVVKEFPGRIVMIPGNHDWHRGKEDGLEYVNRQEVFAEAYLNRGNVFIPDGGCPGPVELQLSDDVMLLIIDTQWWLHKHDKPAGDQCDVENDLDFLFHVEDAIKRNKDKKILMVGHHPMFSNGYHGGRFPLKDHIFPLTAINKKILVPLPVIGSIYPLYRKILGNIQDIPHPRNRALRDGLLNAFKQHDQITYACGHEHNLQLFEKDSVNYIVSGSGCKNTYVRKGSGVDFSHDHKGYVKMQYYDDGSVWSEFWEPTQDGKGTMVFKKQIHAPEPKTAVTSSDMEPKRYIDSMVTVIPGKIFEAKAFKQMVFGSHYRDLWLAPVDVPVLDINYVKGGLTPIKKGGGMATKSLRMRGGDGKQYVLRSIEKFPASTLPKIVRKTFAKDVVKDQISSAHPYSAFVVPELAEAVGVPHTNPRLVYLPDDPALGIYREEFAGTLVLFEERLSGDQKDLESFGEPDDIISTFDVIEKIKKNPKNQVDQKALVKARIFDILLGDWDRHDDQWRWAVHEKKGKEIYRPIPRDRDQVFYKVTGLLPSIVNRKWAIRKFQNFNHDIRDVIGLGFNARYFDRNFLSEMTLEDWKKAAEQIKFDLTDEAIEKAFRLLPDTIEKMGTEEIISKLKSRRYKLPEFAEKYYLFLAKEVDVVGTNKDELFLVERLSSEETRVRVWPLDKDGDKKKKVYDRTFKTSETKEIRLYGLDGEDEFKVTGEVDRSIIVRIIGGDDKDKITDESSVKGFGKMTKVYDTKGKGKHTKTKLDLGTEGKDLRKKDKSVNLYDRKAFKYDHFGPQAFFGYNVDDGVFIGGGFLYKKQGFRKDPYKYAHKLVGNFSTGSQAFNFRHSSNYTDIAGAWDLSTDLKISAPNFQSSFFGLGNETNNDQSRRTSYYWVRLNQVEFMPSLTYNKNTGRNVSFGLIYQYNEPQRTANKFISTLEANLDDENFTSKHFAGVRFNYELDKRDNKILTQRGVHLLSAGAFLSQLGQSSEYQYLNLQGSLSMYMTARWPLQTTLAVRVGGSSNVGDFEFYQANFISGTEHLRGLRRNRFAGRSSFYQNTELRIKLMDLRTYVFPGQIGLIGYYDIGRVWLDNENSDVMHYGFGGGFYISPFDAIVLTTAYSVSDDDNLINVNFGFLF